jgi:DNA invertase Pin-like site-specific DNA recombinase
MKPQAYSYLRFSSAPQEKGDSIRRQTSLRDAWIARKGLVLDESLTIKDFAVSGFRGKNLANGALSGFVEAVKQGRVPKGSYLIIEKIDRFSRDDVDEALPIFTKLVKSGITIVTLEPEKEWNTDALKSIGIIELAFQFYVANQESQKRSDRLGAAWAEKKRNAAFKKLTKRVPSWLRCEINNEGKIAKIVVDEVKASLVKQIFAMAEKGHGSSQIAKQFNRERIPSLLWGSGWHGSSISKLLRNRTVLGEYQPCKGTPDGPKRRVPVGDPVANYYPTVISEAQFIRVQNAVGGRRTARGKVGRAERNLFQGFLRDARDGGKIRHKHIGRTHYLLPKNADRGLSDNKWAFSYKCFEDGVLTLLKEISPSQLRPIEAQAENDDSADRLLEVERRIEKIKARMIGDGDFDDELDVLDRLKAERKKLIELLKKQQAITPEIQKRDLQEAQSVLDMLDEAKGEALTDLRVRLKSVLRSLISEVWMIVEPLDEMRLCFAQLFFRAGGSRVVILISAGKSQNHEFAAGHEKQHSRNARFDLRNYRTDEKMREFIETTATKMRGSTPKAVALEMVRGGKKPYVVAKELEIANSTVYRWAKLAGL